jgi:tetratricopeptide (TPR) repeat protein
MATAKITKKEMAQDEFLEGVFDFGEWLEVHWRKVAIGGGIALAVILAAIAWNSTRESALEDANRLLGSGIDAFAPPATPGAAAAPRYTEALALFEQAEGRAGSGRIADVARLFRARTLVALSRAGEAVPILESLAASGNAGLAATAKVALAEAAEAAGNPERAASIYQELSAATKDAAYPPDAALLMLGGVRQRQGKKDEAKKVYDDVVARFPQSPFATEAKARAAEL